MKIGIISLPLNANYGGIMQAFALQKILTLQGHDVENIEIPHKRMEELKFPNALVVYTKRFIKKCLGKWNKPIKLEQYVNTYEEPVCLKYTNQFINRYIKVRTIRSFSEISPNDYSVIIVGSDQIWRPLYFNDITKAFLSFAKKWDIYRMSYAASFGVNNWEYNKEQTKECSELLKLFNRITVREKSGIELCKKHLSICDIYHVLDPTMLLDKSYYEDLLSYANVKDHPGNIFIYILDLNREKKILIDEIVKDRDGMPFEVGAKYSDINSPLNERIQPPVEEWLKGFVDAKFIITDSFHACVFSIIFQKPFVVISNKERGNDRFISLLQDFHLSDRLITNIFDFKRIKEPNILNDEVYSLLFEKKSMSLKFLSF